MASWLDNIDFTINEWKTVQRRKWNSKSAQMGFGPETCDFDIESFSNVKSTEEVIEIEDPEMWEGSWDILGVKRYVNSSFPNIEDKVEVDREIKELFERLAEAMGGEGDVRLFTWPIVLILATRLGDSETQANNSHL